MSQPEPPHDSLPSHPLATRIERLLEGIGRACSWIWLVLLGTIVSNVVLRYVFGSGRVELEEAQWHLYAVGFLGGIVYCTRTDGHVRVDFLRERFTPRSRAWIDFYGHLLLLLPFVTLVLVFALPFVAESYEVGEISPSPGGLPYRFLIKAAIPAAFALLGLASLARILRLSRFLFAGPEDRARERDRG